MEPPNTRLIKPSEAPRRLSSSLDILRIDELGWNFRVPNPDREVGGREQMGLFFFQFNGLCYITIHPGKDLLNVSIHAQ